MLKDASPTLGSGSDITRAHCKPSETELELSRNKAYSVKPAFEL